MISLLCRLTLHNALTAVIIAFEAAKVVTTEQADTLSSKLNSVNGVRVGDDDGAGSNDEPGVGNVVGAGFRMSA